MDAGWDALERGDWAVALDVFRAAVAQSDEPRTLEGLAWASWWSNDGAGVIVSRERAFKLYRQRDDPVAAARVAIWLGCDHHDFRGEHAVANGWYQRARRLLAKVPICVEAGWLAFQEGAYALELEDDTATARARAAEVAGIAAALDHPDLEFLSLALDGLALVTEGAVSEGMRRLDEVGVAATTGELQDRIATAWSLCYLIYACERVRDFDRASQWCARMQEIATRFVFDLGMGVCRAHYGGVLVLHGRWDLAELELAAAGETLARSRPLAAVESAVRVGELRRRQGREAEAEKLFAESVPHPLAVVGLASIAFDHGEQLQAVEMLEDLLAATPAASVTQRADSLELLARARSSLGDADGSRAAAADLRSVAESVGTRPLQAMAAVADAAVASACGDHNLARRHLEDAVELYDRSGLPYEAECARTELARTLASLRRPKAADGHARRAAERLRALGALYAAQRAERAARSTGATSDAPIVGLSRRETEVIALLAQGLSDRELAERLHISAHTAHRHVSNILTKLGLPSRAAAAALAARHGLGRAVSS